MPNFYFAKPNWNPISAQEILDNIGIYFNTLAEGNRSGDGQIETEAPIIDFCSASTMN